MGSPWKLSTAMMDSLTSHVCGEADWAIVDQWASRTEAHAEEDADQVTTIVTVNSPSIAHSSMTNDPWSDSRQSSNTPTGTMEIAIVEDPMVRADDNEGLRQDPSDHDDLLEFLPSSDDQYCGMQTPSKGLLCIRDTSVQARPRCCLSRAAAFHHVDEYGRSVDPRDLTEPISGADANENCDCVVHTSLVNGYQEFKGIYHCCDEQNLPPEVLVTDPQRCLDASSMIQWEVPIMRSFLWRVKEECDHDSPTDLQECTGFQSVLLPPKEKTEGNGNGGGIDKNDRQSQMNRRRKSRKSRGGAVRRTSHCVAKTGHFCTECGKTKSSKFSLSKHIESVHHQVRPFWCPICHEKVKQAVNLQRHMNANHKVFLPQRCIFPTLKTVEKSWRCPRCNDFSATDRNSLILHVAEAHSKDRNRTRCLFSGPPMECKTDDEPRQGSGRCDFVSNDAVELREHEFKMHFRCVMCCQQHDTPMPLKSKRN